MFEVEEAQSRIISAMPQLGAETLALAEAAGRILAEPIAAPISLPPFDNSAMDGYAVRAADVGNASSDTPVSLRQIAAVPAGQVFEGTVQPGTCVRLFTGSPLPAGADAVVMQEDTRATGDVIEVLDAARPWENVRFAGEDVKQGEVVAPTGTRIETGTLALLAALGLSRVRAARRPVVGILGTGNEIVEAGAPLRPGQIYESNRIAVASLVREAGGVPHVLPLVRDSLDDTRHALSEAFQRADVVITTGGVSVGEHDYVKAAFEAMGGRLEFWKVAMKPGKPFVFGRYAGKFLFGLPGNPVSAFVTFLLLVRPALLAMQGAQERLLAASPGVLAESIPNRGNRRHYVRVRIDATGQVRSSGTQASHALGALARANGLLAIPPDTTLMTGSPVLVLRIP